MDEKHFQLFQVAFVGLQIKLP